MAKLSEQLAELMAEDNYTQSTLASALNISHANISLYLSGNSEPNFNFLIALVEFFNCSADFLIGLTDYPKRDKIYTPVKPFGIHLREILKLKGKSQRSLIISTEISWNTLHNWLIAKSLPSIENLKKLSKFFECSVDFVLGRES